MQYTGTMPFGKHRGKLLSEVPTDYLHWLLSIDVDEYLRSNVTTELEQRGINQSETALTVDPAKVANAWRQRMAWECHPDAGGSGEAMKAVNRGHDVLLVLLQEEFCK